MNERFMNEASMVMTSRRGEGDKNIIGSNDPVEDDDISVHETVSARGAPTSSTEALPNITMNGKGRRGTAPSAAMFTHREISRGASQHLQYTAETSSPKDSGRRKSLQQWLSSAVKVKREEWGILVPVDSMLSPISQERNQCRKSSCTGPHRGFADNDTGFKPTPATLPAAAMQQAGQPAKDGNGEGEQNAIAQTLREYEGNSTPKGPPKKDREGKEEEGKESDFLGESKKRIVELTQSLTSTVGRVSSARKDVPPRQEEEVSMNNAITEEKNGEYSISNAMPTRDHRVKFLSTAMELTLEIGNDRQLVEDEDGKTGMYDHLPASPCSGVIMSCSPRYGVLQEFRKSMASRGIDAQMFHLGWKGFLLPPRKIRLFMTDQRNDSDIWWRYKKSERRHRTGGGREAELGTEDRRVIPLSALANVGPADVAPTNTRSWRPASWWKRETPRSLKTVDLHNEEQRSQGQGKGLAVDEVVPVLALTYWIDGSPRWVGDTPRKILVKPDYLEDMHRLVDGLRFCCLHFHNKTWPQDLQDML